MTNWFASIGSAASGVNAARYGLTVVSQNISNADTVGYTRQRTEQTATDAISVGLYMTRTNGQSLLGGTRVSATDRTVDPVLDSRVRTEHARGSAADTTATSLSGLEQLLPEPGTSGVGANLDSFWASWGSLANHPDDSGVRTTVLSAASQAAASLNGLSASLSAITDSTTASLGNDVAQAQTAATQLADLNAQIGIATATGQSPNNLLDQRDQLLDTLSKLVGGVATIAPNGAASVDVGGQSLVSGTTAGTIAVDSSAAVSVNGTAVTLSGGSAASRVTSLTTTLPGYRSKLDAVADALATAGNAIQAAGYDKAGTPGTPLFAGSGASGISVALTDPTKLAASATPGGNLDGSNAAAASQRGSAVGGPDAQYRALVADVASASSRAQQAQSAQSAVVTNVDAQRASVSGVSYDDEVTQLLTFQHAFEASSRVLTTIDSMLDTLINHMGVG